MRRSLLALALVGSIVPIASLASAQDATQDAGAPITTTTTTATTTTATTTTAPTPTPTQTQTQTQTQTAPPASTLEQEPLRLGRLIELEADRARARRYGSSVVGMVIGAGTIASGALFFGVDSGNSNLNTIVDMLGVFSMVMGGLQIVDGIISLVVPSPTERLFDRYAPIAIDKSLTAADRLRRGEMMLEAMANSERSQRTMNGASSIVIGILLAGVGVFVGAYNDLWVGTDSSLALERVIITTSVELVAAASLAEGIGKVVWERGAAEVAYEHWRAMHQTVVVQTSKVKFAPMFGPTHNGAMAGFSLRF